MSHLLSLFKSACSSFDINTLDSHQSLCECLDALAGDLGKDVQARIQLGTGDVWSDIHRLWRDLVHAQLTFWDGDDDDDDDGGEEDTASIKKQLSLRALCVSLARFIRNLVAGVAANQTKAFEDELIIRRLLHYYSSWSSWQDKQATFAARILTQMLSNIIAGNEPLISSLWETYLSLKEDQVVLIRLLASPDNRILLAVFTMINSCIRDSKSRTKLLTRSTIGARICVLLLDDMVKLFDANEATDGAQAFDVGYSIFARIIESGLMPDLYLKLAIADEIVTPHQTTLLKLLDSYLQSAPVASPGTRSTMTKIHAKLCPMLSNLFFLLSSYAQKAIRKSLGPSAPGGVPSLSPPAELDVLLPKVCEALVLVTQCIITVTLTSQNQNLNGHPGTSPSSGSGSGSGSAASMHEDVHAFFNQVRFDGLGLVECLVDVLRLLDRFLPRINFGRPVSALAESAVEEAPAMDSPGFNYLKRDLVRLMGILCNENQAVQDRLRRCGGIEVVMNLCVIDDRNPYLREHAILALHNLLKDNAANQAVVEEIKPMGQWDEYGVLKDTPGAIRK